MIPRSSLSFIQRSFLLVALSLCLLLGTAAASAGDPSRYLSYLQLYTTSDLVQFLKDNGVGGALNGYEGREALLRMAVRVEMEKEAKEAEKQGRGQRQQQQEDGDGPSRTAFAGSSIDGSAVTAIEIAVCSSGYYDAEAERLAGMLRQWSAASVASGERSAAVKVSVVTYQHGLIRHAVGSLLSYGVYYTLAAVGLATSGLIPPSSSAAVHPYVALFGNTQHSVPIILAGYAVTAVGNSLFLQSGAFEVSVVSSGSGSTKKKSKTVLYSLLGSGESYLPDVTGLHEMLLRRLGN